MGTGQGDAAVPRPEMRIDSCARTDPDASRTLRQAYAPPGRMIGLRDSWGMRWEGLPQSLLAADGGVSTMERPPFYARWGLRSKTLTVHPVMLYCSRCSADKVVTVTEQQLADKEEILSRLRRVEGQIRGIQRMITDERDCEAVVTQLMAARAALDRASMVILTHHMQECLADPSGRPSQRQLQRIIEFFVRFAGPIPETDPIEE